MDAFELWCWRRLLRVSWTARRSKQSILKEINPGCSLEGLMLKLKLQYFRHLMLTHWKDSDTGRDWGQEEKGMTEYEMAGWHHQLNGRESEWTSGDGDGQGGLTCCDWWGHRELDTTDRLKWTELNWYPVLGLPIALVVKNLTARAGDKRNSEFDHWVGKTPWRKAWQPIPVFFPGKCMDSGTWRATVHSIGESYTTDVT